MIVIVNNNDLNELAVIEHSCEDIRSRDDCTASVLQYYVRHSLHCVILIYCFIFQILTFPCTSMILNCNRRVFCGSLMISTKKSDAQRTSV